MISPLECFFFLFISVCVLFEINVFLKMNWAQTSKFLYLFS